MSGIAQQLKEVDKILRARKSKYSNQPISEEYSPRFLAIIKRNGQFVCTRETLNATISECWAFYVGRKNFNQWLEENNLQKIESNGTIKIKSKIKI